MKTKLCDKAKWFLSGIVVGFTSPSLLYSTLFIVAMPNSLGISILGRGCLNNGDAKITVTWRRIESLSCDIYCLLYLLTNFYGAVIGIKNAQLSILSLSFLAFIVSLSNSVSEIPALRNQD